MDFDTLPWNPTIPDQFVRLIRNPGHRGVTTGDVEVIAGRLHVLVSFGPNEEALKPYDRLEIYGTEPESIQDLFAAARFGRPSDLRQILTYEKVKGYLTNVFYSMESSNTDFYAYQFKPVLKFLESPSGRLLIADEVGLGKTIESTFIWKELQARQDARRLLIVCPSMLRDKWANDLKDRFNLESDVLNAKQLLEKLQSVVQRGKPESFVYVVSYEGIRPPRNWRNPEKTTSTRAELARLINDSSFNDEIGKLLDLVIFDEAHKARNSETLTNQLIGILCDAASHAVLLTATPIQTHTNNLFQLLRLVSPDDFTDTFNFEYMLRANKPIIEAQSLIWKNDATEDFPDPIAAAQHAIERALQFSYFKHNSRLQRVYQDLATLQTGATLEPETRARMAEVLESTSLFGQFMTRTRKRDVMKRVLRDPFPKAVIFSADERAIYDHVTTRIREMARGQDNIVVFTLITRQRQMASSLVAALEAWKEKDTQDIESYLWEDFGLLASTDRTQQMRQTQADWDLGLEIDLAKLERKDSKYKVLLQALKDPLQINPKEKFVLFSYFKGTLRYLKRRLESDGITCELIAGGVSRQDRGKALKRFEENPKCHVLLSSEVGSEGIDLQFCRVLINYDLPWNPMRVEQRIGRIDRLGQKAEKISIINFYCRDSIEDRILERLYERIRIFKESIGDIEEILGEETEKILYEVIRADLTDHDRERKAKQEIDVMARQIEEQRKIENEAINMVAFSDYILESIDNSRKQGRWLRPEDLEAFVQDFFRKKYPGTVIEPKSGKPHVFDISLSLEARSDLQVFFNQHRSSVRTSLFQGVTRSTTCFFDAKIAGTVGNLTWELLDPSHPLINWISHEYETEEITFQPVSAIQLSQSQVFDLGLSSGFYVYAIQQWAFEGMRKDNRLAYRAVSLKDSTVVAGEVAEMLTNRAMTDGDILPSPKNRIDDFNAVLNALKQCNRSLLRAFAEESDLFTAINTDWCNVQRNNTQRFRDRRVSRLQETIDRLRLEGKNQGVNLLISQINAADQTLRTTLRRIEKKTQVEPSNKLLAAGLILIRD